MHDPAKILVVDDDADLASSIARLLGRHGHSAEAVNDAELLAKSYEPGAATCILTDMMMGATNGFALAEAIRRRDPAVAFVFMTAWPTVGDAVYAVRLHGGFDYLEKPLEEPRLLAAVQEGIGWSSRSRRAHDQLSRLTKRELEVFRLLARGKSNKVVAAHLSVSPKTIEDHRASIMSKLDAENLADLISLAREAGY